MDTIDKKSAEDAGIEILAAINAKNPEETLLKIQGYIESMKNPEIGAEYVSWITTPVNVTNIHNALTSELEINPRALLIKRRPLSRPQRGILLIYAMEIAIKRQYQLV